MKQFPLEHKIAVVTGCAGGIGAGIALGLAEAGADIVGVDLQDLEETAVQVRALGRRFLAFRVDADSGGSRGRRYSGEQRGDAVPSERL